MQVLLLATGQDTAGMGGRVASAFSRHAPEFRVQSVTGSTNYMSYPGSVRLRHRAEGTRLYEKADVVHLRNTFAAVQLYGRRARNKPLVITHHGTLFRQEADKLRQQGRNLGAVQLVSTVDLLLYGGDDMAWMPSPFNGEYLQLVRTHNYKPHGEIIRIVHSPTNREVKGTDKLIEAIEVLKQRGLPVEFDLIERQTNKVCLARKGNADIFVDQLLLGYGCNAIEAWGMGIPVVAGTTDPDIRAKMIEVFGKLPFVEAEPTVESLVEVLTKLVNSKAARTRAANLGIDHFRRFHDERLVVNQLRSIYFKQRQR